MTTGKPSEYELIEMERRADQLLRFTSGNLPWSVRNELTAHEQMALSEYVASFPGEEVARDLKTAVEIIRRIP